MVVDGTKYEIKCSQLHWNKHERYWQTNWQNIKWDQFNTLIVVLYTPDGLHLFEHDRKVGVATSGQSQEATGGQIAIRGPRGEADIKKAQQVIFEKIKSMHMTSLTWEDLRAPPYAAIMSSR